MADGAQQCGLDRIAAPERLGLERLARQPLAVDRHAEQRRQRRQQAAPRARAASPLPLQVDRPDATPTRPELVRVRAGVAVALGPEDDGRALHLEGTGGFGRDPVELAR